MNIFTFFYLDAFVETSIAALSPTEGEVLLLMREDKLHPFFGKFCVCKLGGPKIVHALLYDLIYSSKDLSLSVPSLDTKKCCLGITLPNILQPNSGPSKSELLG